MTISDYIIDKVCPFLITITVSSLIYILCVEVKKKIYWALGWLLFSPQQIDTNPEKLEYYRKMVDPRKYVCRRKCHQPEYRYLIYPPYS